MLLGLIGAFYHDKQASCARKPRENGLVCHKASERVLVGQAEKAQVLYGLLEVGVDTRHAHDGAPAVQAELYPGGLAELDPRGLVGKGNRGRTRAANGQSCRHKLNEMATSGVSWGFALGNCAGARIGGSAVEHLPVLAHGRANLNLVGRRGAFRWMRFGFAHRTDASHGCLGKTLGHVLVGKQLVEGLLLSGGMRVHPRAPLSCFLPRATHEYTVFTGTPIIFATSLARYPSHTVRYKA